MFLLFWPKLPKRPQGPPARSWKKRDFCKNREKSSSGLRV